MIQPVSVFLWDIVEDQMKKINVLLIVLIIATLGVGIVETAVNTPPPHPLNISVPEKMVHISGRIVDKNGNGIAGVPIYLFDANGNPYQSRSQNTSVTVD